MNGLLEILTNKKWMMHPESLQALRMVIQQNLAGHVALEQFDKKQAYCMGMTAEGDTIHMSMPSERGEQEAEEQEVSYVTILPVCGPITRNGDACSYGSIDLRDAVMEIADEEECKGIVFYINSPGGSAAAIADYKYAINYARERGKKCVAFVDGMCASAAMYLSALCDERYYMNEQDQIGSIGTMAAFYTEKDGEKNQYTNETYHEIYATESYEKNKWYRDAANGEYDELIADLNKTNEQFMADVKASCPNATDDHLHGKMFDAKDVEGILTDGQSTLDAVIGNLIALSGDQSIDTEEGCKPKKCEAQTSNNIDMTNYPLTQAALGVEELVVTEEGTHLDVSLLDNCEKALEDKNTAMAEAEQKLADAEKALADANEAHQTECEAHNAALEKVANELAETMKSLEESKKALAEKEEQMESLNSQLSTLNAELTGAKEALATAEQTLADKDEQIKALTEKPAEQQSQGDAPANNGNEAQEQTMKTDYPVWDGKESMAQFKARRDAWHKAHNC